MKIHYISCHSVLEYDEIKLFAELGYDVHSNGAYRDPRGAHTLPRPGIPEIPFDQDFFDLTATHPKTNLPDELIKPYDVIIIMHSPQVLFQNWPNFKKHNKRVVWRTIGQSTGAIERKIQDLVTEGLQVVRYSPNERNLANYAGEHALIRFYKDPKEYKDWNGSEVRVINFSQSLKGRRDFCHYDEIMALMAGFPSMIYGTGNEDLGELNGGELSYEGQLKKYRDARLMIYGGTWPASYTLSLIEAMMTGTPVVAIGKSMAHIEKFEQFDFYEVPDIIENNESGFCHEDIPNLRNAVQALLADEGLARKISAGARKRAIELFGKDKIKKEWKAFIEK